MNAVKENRAHETARQIAEAAARLGRPGEVRHETVTEHLPAEVLQVLEGMAQRIRDLEATVAQTQERTALVERAASEIAAVVHEEAN